jgi:hypothetical protein
MTASKVAVYKCRLQDRHYLNMLLTPPQVPETVA